jgi:hypothetical protein
LRWIRKELLWQSLSKEEKRENNSAPSRLVRVFTQPRPKPDNFPQVLNPAIDGAVLGIEQIVSSAMAPPQRRAKIVRNCWIFFRWVYHRQLGTGIL